MFEDKRSKRLVFVAQCILNQNAKLDQCAHYPGAITEIVSLLVEAGLGIVQMPCPELLCLGLDRQADRAVRASIAAEDTRIAGRMREVEGRALCRHIADNMVYQIQEYRKNGFAIVGILGINGSPTCGVESTLSSNHEQENRGMFIQALSQAMAEGGFSIPMRGIKAYEPQQAVLVVKELLQRADAASSGPTRLS